MNANVEFIWWASRKVWSVCGKNEADILAKCEELCYKYKATHFQVLDMGCEQCKYTEQELWQFVSRADTHERVEAATNFLTKLPGLDTDLYDQLMDALAYTSRELYRA